MDVTFLHFSFQKKKLTEIPLVDESRTGVRQDGDVCHRIAGTFCEPVSRSKHAPGLVELNKASLD